MPSPIQYRLCCWGKKRTAPFFITNSHKSVIANPKLLLGIPPTKSPRLLLNGQWMPTVGYSTDSDWSHLDGDSWWTTNALTGCLIHVINLRMEGQRTLVSLCTLASINQVCRPCIITWCAAEGATFGSHFRYVPLWLDAQEVASDNYFPIFGWFAPSRKQLKVNRTKNFDVVLITNNAGFVIVNSLLISNTWSSGIYL